MLGGSGRAPGRLKKFKLGSNHATMASADDDPTQKRRASAEKALQLLSGMAAATQGAGEGHGGPRTGAGRPRGPSAQSRRATSAATVMADLNGLWKRDPAELARIKAKRLLGPNERREVQAFNDDFVASGRLRATITAPIRLDPSHVRVPRTQELPPLVFRVPAALAARGFEAGVIVSPSEHFRRAKRKDQLLFNVASLNDLYLGVDFERVRAVMEEKRDVQGEHDWGFDEFRQFLAKEFVAAGLPETGRERARDILHWLGFEFGRRQDGSHYQARRRADVIYHRDSLLPYLGAIFAETELFCIHSLDGSWFNELGKSHGFINVATDDGMISRSNLGGIGAGMFDAVTTDYGVLQSWYWEKKRGLAVSITNEDICDFGRELCERILAEARNGDADFRGKLHVFVLDGGRGNTAIGDEAFDAKGANKNAPNEWNPLTGDMSAVQILTQLGRFEPGMTRKDCQYELSKWRQLYTKVLLQLERVAWEHNVLVIFLPHSHPELAFIEYYWRKIKWPARDAGSTSVPVMRKLIFDAQESITADDLMRMRRTTESYLKYYLHQLDPDGADKAGVDMPRPPEYATVSQYADKPWPTNLMVDLPPRPVRRPDYVNLSREWKDWLGPLQESLHMLNMVCRYGKSFPVGEELYDGEVNVDAKTDVDPAPATRTAPSTTKRARSLSGPADEDDEDEAARTLAFLKKGTRSGREIKVNQRG
jgi:hypothetical protein